MGDPQLARATHLNQRCTGDDSVPGSAWERIAEEAPASRVHNRPRRVAMVHIRQLLPMRIYFQTTWGVSAIALRHGKEESPGSIEQGGR